MIEPRLLKRLETKKAQLDELRPLPTAAIKRLRDEIRVRLGAQEHINHIFHMLHSCKKKTLFGKSVFSLGFISFLQDDPLEHLFQNLALQILDWKLVLQHQIRESVNQTPKLDS